MKSIRNFCRNFFSILNNSNINFENANGKHFIYVNGNRKTEKQNK